MTHQVLMLCYHYPPSNNGGTERSVKFVQYLPQFGWQPTVITTQALGRAKEAQTPIIYSYELLMLLRALRTKPRPTVPPSPAKRRSRVAFWRHFIVLDPQIGWGLFAFWAAIKQIRWKRMDVIFSTSPPVSAHVLALALKWFTRKPWVMDLRDPWTFEPISYYLEQSPLRLRNERRIERLCFRHADAVIINTPQSAQRYQEIYPEFADKIEVITNGFDSEELQLARSSLPPLLNNFEADTFIISHTGNLERRPNFEIDSRPHELFQAIKILIESGTIKREKLRLILAGGLPTAVKELVTELGLEEVILFPGRLSHLETLSLMQHSHLLVLYEPYGDGMTYVRGKLYEYLGSGKPILGIVADGASRELLKQAGQPWLVDPGDVEGTTQRLRQAVQNMPSTVTSALDLSRYERQHLTERLTNILERVIKS